MGCGVFGMRYRVWGVGCGVWTVVAALHGRLEAVSAPAFGFRLQNFGFRIHNLNARAQASKSGSGFMILFFTTLDTGPTTAPKP